MRVGLHEGVLHGIFGVFAVTGDVHGEAEDFALVAIDEFLKCRCVAGLRGLDEEVFVLAGDSGWKAVWVR